MTQTHSHPNAGAAADQLGQVVGSLLNEAMAADRDRREKARHSFFCPVAVTVQNDARRSFSAFSRDISPEGIGLLHNMPLPAGEVTITIPTRSAGLRRLRTEIVWCRPCGEGWFLSGGRFLGVEP